MAINCRPRDLIALSFLRYPTMGNTVAKDFAKISVAKNGTVPLFQKELIAPGSIILKDSMKVVLRQDHERKTTIVFDEDTMLPLFVTENKSKGGVHSITKDSRGKTLFLTTAPSKNKRLIYKAPKSAPRKPVEKDTGSLDTTSTHSSSSYHSTGSASSRGTTSSALYARFQKNDIPCTAQIEIDNVGAAKQAFFSLIVWKGTGPDYMQVYKAVQIAQVKYGCLVVDNAGQVVGKCQIDEARMEPVVEVARGADLPSVIATASALVYDF